MPYLTKPTRYTARGEEVTIIKKSHPNVWLVQNVRGVIHSVTSDAVSEEMVVDVVIQVFEEPNLFNQK